MITDHAKFKPVSTQYLLIGMLKSLYPDKFSDAIAAAKGTPRDALQIKWNCRYLAALSSRKKILSGKCAQFIRKNERRLLNAAPSI